MLQVSTSPTDSSNVRRGFEDGLGRRYRPAARNDSDAPIDILCFRHEISDVPAFDFALRERVSRLSDLQHPATPASGRSTGSTTSAAPWCSCPMAWRAIRLIEILTDVERTGQVLDLNAALYLVRQVVSGIGALHQHARVAHGAIAPERLFVTPRGRLLIAEYALGAALEQLKYSRERYWKELRVALPMNVGLARFDERAISLRWELSRSPSCSTGRFETRNIQSRSRSSWHRHRRARLTARRNRCRQGSASG